MKCTFIYLETLSNLIDEVSVDVSERERLYDQECALWMSQFFELRNSVFSKFERRPQARPLRRRDTYGHIPLTATHGGLADQRSFDSPWQTDRDLLMCARRVTWVIDEPVPGIAAMSDDVVV